MSKAIGIVFDEEGRAILRMKAATRDFLLSVLPSAIEDGDFVKVDLTALSATPERFAMVDDYPCMILAFGMVDDHPCYFNLAQLTDLRGVRKPAK
jgi:hypothetical protein